MMSNVLLIDYGASRIKSAFYSSIYESPIAIFESDGSFIKYGNSNKIPNSFFSDSLIIHLDFYFSKISKLNLKQDVKIFLCCEMHGFSLVNKNSLGQYYYSWRFNHPNSQSALQELRDKNFIEKTKMIPRPGLPIVNILSDFLQNNLNERRTLLTLPQIICNNLGQHNNTACITLLHSTGFFTAVGEEEDSHLITGYELPINFPTVLSDYNEPLGFIYYHGYKYNVYFGFGDLQAAFYGSDIKDNEILINIGTGSQIISSSKNKSTFQQEERPFFNNDKLKCITHIPAGRFLNSWSKFYNNLNLENNFWDELSMLDKIDLDIETIEIDFNSFLSTESSSFDKIRNRVIKDSKLRYKNLLVSLMKSFINQYLYYLDGLVHKDSVIVMGGGVPKKIPVLSDIIKENLDREVRIIDSNVDLTIKGLRDFLIKEL